ncbi:hypothetical protein L227DRAFT_370008 [Lentinus tigrinus ALCF2SS1-6]|uniref:Uncharacterized protein n=1 Tax=Lentinus tigrinus ALCF2SS1-6 TaxID=1328759 RepID=A0A5C2RV51_9APHY|nr:hypothetical protein L227DRAFT_370008 [Lentinus tigrinus ALCF2SS1-6]
MNANPSCAACTQRNPTVYCMHRAHGDVPKDAHKDAHKEEPATCARHAPRVFVSSCLRVFVSSCPPRGVRVRYGIGPKRETSERRSEALRVRRALDALPSFRAASGERMRHLRPPHREISDSELGDRDRIRRRVSARGTLALALSLSPRYLSLCVMPHAGCR